MPKPLVEEVLEIYHDLQLIVHQSVSRTYLRVKEKFYWYSMNKATKTCSNTKFAVKTKKLTEKRSGLCHIPGWGAKGKSSP